MNALWQQSRSKLPVRARQLRLLASRYRWPLCLIGLPMLLVTIYYGLIASDQYVSEGEFIVRQDSASVTPQVDIGSLMGGASASQHVDALLLKAFLESSDMLDYLEVEHGFRDQYRASGIDWISRLGAAASREDVYAYYLGKIRVSVNPESSIVHVEVRAFEPAYAQRILRAMASRSEGFVNGIGQGLAREQMAFVQQELDRAQERMRGSTERLLALQNQSSMLSVEQEVQTVAGIITSLEGELAAQRTELSRLMSFLTKDAPEVVAVRSRISALERQIQQERRRQVGENKGALSTLAVPYQEAQMAVKLATDLYQSTLTALETVRVEASRKVKHLVTVSSPTLPQEALYPRRLYVLTTLLVALVLVYGIGRLILATIEDHRE